jgi:N-acetylglucosamine-6-sulfatase
VVVMTDDQALTDVESTHRTQRALVDHGASYSQFHASYPLCCPSRATRARRWSVRMYSASEDRP